MFSKTSSDKDSCTPSSSSSARFSSNVDSLTSISTSTSPSSGSISTSISISAGTKGSSGFSIDISNISPFFGKIHGLAHL